MINKKWMLAHVHFLYSTIYTLLIYIVIIYMIVIYVVYQIDGGFIVVEPPSINLNMSKYLYNSVLLFYYIYGAMYHAI